MNIKLNWRDRLLISLSCLPIPILGFLLVDNLISKILFVFGGLVWVNATKLAFVEYKKEKNKQKG